MNFDFYSDKRVLKKSFSGVNAFEMDRSSPVSLIKHHIFYTVQLQVHVRDDMHETTRGADDSVTGEKISCFLLCWHANEGYG